MISSTQTNSPLAKTDAKTAVATATARLKAAHLRITQPRLTILAAMFRRSQPESIETIHEALGKNGCDLVTVYRCMAVFEEIGIVRRTYFHNGTALYSLRLDDAPHYHIVSKATNSAIFLTGRSLLTKTTSGAINAKDSGVKSFKGS